MERVCICDACAQPHLCEPGRARFFKLEERVCWIPAVGGKIYIPKSSNPLDFCSGYTELPEGVSADSVVGLHFSGVDVSRIDDMLGLEPGTAREQVVEFWKGMDDE